MNKKDNVINNVTGGDSVPLICSADGHSESAERDYAQIRAAEVQKLFHGLGLRKHAAAIAYIVEGEIITAIAIEREECAQICEDVVTFSEEHINYAPADAEIPCGWCDGLEKCASLIRARR